MDEEDEQPNDVYQEREVMKIKVFADLSPEHMFARGKEEGLSEKAADYFRYFSEVELELTVKEDGDVIGAKVIQAFRESEETNGKEESR